MFILSITPSQVSSSVWSAGSRTLTGLLGTVLSNGGALGGSIATGGSVDLSPTAGLERLCWIIVVTGGSGAARVSNWDGVSVIVYNALIGANANNGYLTLGYPGNGSRIDNSGGVSAITYGFVYMDFH